MSEAELVSLGTEDEPQTLAHQMIYYFYRRQATPRDAWDYNFWQEFRRHHPNDELDPKALRAHFFHEIMQQSSQWKDLPYEVVQYLNPLFNRIRTEALEFRDLVPGVDYMHVETAADLATVVANDGLPPLCLEAGSTQTMVSPSRATKRYISPSTEEIRSFVTAELSEMLWTEDEKAFKPTLDVMECMSRIGCLTRNGIALESCMEPGMACYQRFHTDELVSRSDYGTFKNGTLASTPLHPPGSSTPLTHPNVPFGGRMHPIASSTPLVANLDSTPMPHPIASSTPVPANRDLTTHPIPTTSRQDVAAAAGMLNPSRILKHVRSKPRKGVPKKD